MYGSCRGRGRRAALALGLASAAAAFACERAGPDREAGLRIDTTQSGRVVVTNPPPDAPGVGWALREELRIGRPDGDGPDVFGSVGALAVDGEGRIHVLDDIAQEVRVFEPDGRHAHTFGGRGSGPGEFRDAVGIAIGPRGRVLVVDARNARYSIFNSDGELEAERPRPVRGSPSPWAGAFDAEGRYVDWGLSFPEESPDVVGGRIIRYEPVRLGPNRGKVEFLPPLEAAREMAAGGTIPMPFYANRLILHQGRDGHHWFALAREYRVYERTAEGDTLREIVVPATPVPTGDRERGEILDATSGRPNLRDAYLEALPATRPVVRHIFGDGAGGLLVVAESDDSGGLPVIDVFDASGVHLGRVAVPENLELRRPAPIARGPHLYGVVQDDLDVSRVVRLRLAEIAD